MAGSARAYAFGRHRLVPTQRALLADGREISIGSRCFDLLLVLVEGRDRVLLKDELIQRVWPRRVVEEGNLSVHVAALRKLLGKGSIATLPGRGYRFVAAVEELDSADSAASQIAPAEVGEPAALPRTVTRPLSKLIGRDSDLEQLEALLGGSRLVTVVGAGGIGKTRLALAIAFDERVRRSFPSGVWFADLGTIEDAKLVPTVIASALEIPIRDNDVLRGVSLFLSTKRGLLIVDGCEHLLEPVTAAVETILGTCPNIAMLATSREPLRAAGESVHRVRPLRTAPVMTEIGADQLQSYPASELFVERARAILGTFAPSGGDARNVMDICRRLDGIPLAIELAVPMLQGLSLSELRERLNTRFGLLTAGRRTALPRQQTMKATVDWSLDLLNKDELELLLPLTVFVGGWTAEAATHAAGRPKDDDETFRRIASLIDKSLIHADLAPAQSRYGMLDSTRYYAAARMSASAQDAARQGLVRWLLKTYARAEIDWPFMPDEDWFERYAPEVENLRAGLAWAIGPDGDAALGAELASYTEHVWGELSLASELRHWFDLAIPRITETTPPDVAGRLWLGRCGWLSIGNPDGLAASRQAIDLFRIAGERIDLGRALWRHAFQHIALGDFDTAEPFVEEAGRVLRDVQESKALVSWLRMQAQLRSRQQQLDVAERSLAEALSLARRLRSPRDIALTLGDIAETHFVAGRLNEAIRTAQDALASLGSARDRSAWVQHIEGALASYLLAEGNVTLAHSITTRRLQVARMMGLHREVVDNLERLGLIAAMTGDVASAGRLLGYSKSRNAQGPALRSFSSLAIRDRLEAELHERLAPADLERLVGEGARLTDEELVASAVAS
jgi:predicted ATPase/DNA-binding winged helix-turn-helix (wHTH) protein